jgi:C4-dicarboxylate-specific signal transduction histidine kinase
MSPIRSGNFLPKYMPSPFAFRDFLNRRVQAVCLLALAVILAVGWTSFEVTLSGSLRNAGEQAERRLALFDRTLEAIIERFHYLPSTIALAAEVRAVLAEPNTPVRRETANGFLSRLNDIAGAAELFVMDVDGRVVTASNWWAYNSFVGENLGYRPYFEEAMADGDAKFYAVGAVTGVAGYFLARRIDGEDGPLGVAVTKINLGEIEANWWRSGELIGMVDVNDITILSTRPDWRYRPISPMQASTFSMIAPQMRYGDRGAQQEPIAVDIWPSRGVRFAHITEDDAEAGGLYVVDEMRLPIHQWRIISFTPAWPLFRDAWLAALTAALGLAALGLIVTLLLQRRRMLAQRLSDHERLEQRVAERTEDLHIANEALRAEIEERIRAEAAERALQGHLVQAAKLASLGQALAGVAHEVSQPVAALTTHLASAKLLATRQRDPEMKAVLGHIDRIADRLAALTGHLKTFARKQSAAPMRADLGATITNALDLIEHKLRTLAIEVDYHRPAADLLVAGNPVHIEQVLINLFSNAADAMGGQPRRRLTISTLTSGTGMTIMVSDTGTGISPEALPRIFDPFYSTKGPGDGLGLGLAISYGLVSDMGGTLLASSPAGGGATFTLTLPLIAAAVPAESEAIA